jgi:hypothetical protein
VRSHPCRTLACLTLVASACNALWIFPAHAYERDVHYGLTFWLALKADFAEHEAEAIATGDARVDSGGPNVIDANLDFSCAQHDRIAAERVQDSHYPSEGPVPSLPDKRVVVAGSDAAKREINRLLGMVKGQEGKMLSLFGRALHPYQDSWSHAGIPGVPNVGEAIHCDPGLSLAHSAARGGPDSHKADLTFGYPQDVLSWPRRRLTP